MIRCPTCGLDWSLGTQTCPKDGTRLFERAPERIPTPIDVAPLGSSAGMPPPPAMVAPPLEFRSGGRRALDLKPTIAATSAPEPRSSPSRAVPRTQLEARAVARVPTPYELPDPERPRTTGNRSSPRTAPAPLPAVQPLPVNATPDAPNPWGDAGGTDPTFKRQQHLTPPLAHPVPHDADDPLIGAQLGEYRVIARLGSGGMGIVYRGEQPEIGKQVAIKVLRPELASDPRQVQRLRDEARAVNAVHHPGLINIFSFGETPEGAKYFVMDLLEGQSLDEYLAARGGKLKEWEALPILEGALSALDAAHGAGVIHRDLKPSNIFLVDLPDHTHLVKLLDFGLAKLSAQRSNSPKTMNVVVGTPEYMAPEQARALEVSPRTDLYAMGIVAYEMLTGDVPFNSESAVETLMMQLEVVPKLPGEIEPTIPEQLEQLVMRMLEKLPEDRPASAAEVKREIARIKRQLTNAETQISQATSIAETLIPPEPASAETTREHLPVDARRIETDVSGTIDPAEVVARSEANRLKLQRPRPPWVVPALAGAAAVLVLALVAYALSKRQQPSELVVPPPPAVKRIEAPAPPEPEPAEPQVK